MEILTTEKKELIKQCGRFLRRSLNKVMTKVKPGVSTDHLDEVAETSLRSNGCEPSFKEYEPRGGGHHYPASLCVSVNDEIVHGLPNKNRILSDGDIVSLDLGARYKGVCTDMAVTIAVGNISSDASKLIKTTEKSLDIGISQIKPGVRVGDIGFAIACYVKSAGFDVIREYVGHGIGSHPHQAPAVPNFGHKNTGEELIDGIALAIEPMVSAGDWHTSVGEDGWTVSTADGSLSAHFEHTVLIENGEPVIVTR